MFIHNYSYSFILVATFEVSIRLDVRFSKVYYLTPLDLSRSSEIIHVIEEMR